jgi:hypothetical protein
MSSISSLVEFVNYQGKRLDKILTKHPADAKARVAYKTLTAQFEEVAKVLTEQHEKNLSLEKRVNELKAELAKRQISLDNLDLKPHDIVGLPEDVIKQLSISEGDRQEFKFLEMIESAGGTMTLDKLIIQLYRDTGEIHDRAKLNAKLYRMTSKEMLYSVPGKRGVYTIYKPEGDAGTTYPLLEDDA